MGFNNEGAEAVAARLKNLKASGRWPRIPIGINLGKSKITSLEDAPADYLQSFRLLKSFGDYFVINVSSPNTPNLRELQRGELLADLLSALQKRNEQLAQTRSGARKPLLVKIAPDLTEPQLESIIEVAQRAGVSGIIATNTTIDRKGLRTPVDQVIACGDGGLSGAPLRARSNEVISFIYRATSGRLPIIGVGGIFTAHDAWEKICAGASLIQLYTGFIYEGPGVAKSINAGLQEILKREGFSSLDDAIGCTVK
jgi:dihydroorotate dehydrogenase